MVGLFMISFSYQGHTYYANVICYAQDPPVYFISIITRTFGIPPTLLLQLRNDGFELSIYSPNLASEELVKAIGEKLIKEIRLDVA